MKLIKNSIILSFAVVLSFTTTDLKAQDFGADVAALTGGSLTIEVLPAGAVVGPRDIMDAVDAGLVEGGFAWTHYWGGKTCCSKPIWCSRCGRGCGT